MNAFHFLRPAYLFLLLPYIALLIVFWRVRLRDSHWSQICDPQLLPYILQTGHHNKKPLWIISLIVFVAIFAGAGPTWQRLPLPVFRNSSALVIALDLSSSMNAQDSKPNRISRARYKITDLLQQRKDGQTALVAYAGSAFIVTPLTRDVATIENQLSALSPQIMPIDGNATQMALQKCQQLLKQAGVQAGQILLVSDGSDAVPQLSSVLEHSYQLLILGIGSTQGAPIADDQGGFLKEDNGTIRLAKLDQNALIQLANQGGGIYQTVSDNDQDIQTLISEIERFTRLNNQGQALQDTQLSQWQDAGPYLLVALLPFAALLFRQGLLSVLMMAVLLSLPEQSKALDWQGLWQTQDQQAYQAYQQKAYAKAAQQFSNPAWKAAAAYQAGDYETALTQLKSAPDAYNEGNVLAKQGRLQDALAAYQRALAENPTDEDARYNKTLVEEALKQQSPPEASKPNKSSSKNTTSDPNTASTTSANNEAKPEQKPENTLNDSKNRQSSEKPDSSGTKQTGANTAKKSPPQTSQTQQNTQQLLSKEQQQANEQWLKRIPDDPAGLLRRKFAYQYQQEQR